MALLHLEGFDKISTLTGESSKTDVSAWLSYNDYFNIGHHAGTTVNDMHIYPGWGNGDAISLGDGGSGSFNYLGKCVTTSATLIVGFAFKPSVNASTQSESFVNFSDVSLYVENHFQLKISQGSTLELYGNDVYLGQAKNCLFKDRWSYIEIKVTFGTSGSYELRVNGETVASDTGVTTSKGGSTQADTVILNGLDGGSTSALSCLYDDWYICDALGSDNTDFLGAIKIETLTPDGAGDDTDFTPLSGSNFQNVDEVPIDGDTTYNFAGTSGNLDLFTATSLTDIDGVICGVLVQAYSSATEATVVGVMPKVKSSTTEGTGGAGYVSGTTYQAVDHVFEVDPSTSVAWTTSNITSMQIGYEVE